METLHLTFHNTVRKRAKSDIKYAHPHSCPPVMLKTTKSMVNLSRKTSEALNLTMKIVQQSRSECMYKLFSINV